MGHYGIKSRHISISVQAQLVLIVVFYGGIPVNFQIMFPMRIIVRKKKENNIVFKIKNCIAVNQIKINICIVPVFARRTINTTNKNILPYHSG